MFLSKRIKKLHKKNVSVPPKVTKNPTAPLDPTKTLRCRYADIPPQQRLIYPSPVYVIQGDIPLMEYNGQLITEISFLNEFRSSQNVSITEVLGQKIISMKFNDERLGGNELPSCDVLLTHLSQSENPEMSEWIELFKSYSLTYSKVMQRQSRKKMKSDQRKRFFIHVTEETEKRKKELLETFPCFELKYRMRNHQNQLKEARFTESFIEGTGYSLEEFASLILQEGVPQLMPYDNPLGNHVIKVILANYFTIKDSGLQIPELKSTLLMKSNFARNIEFKSYVFMNYETNTFGMDMILAVTGLGEPYIFPKNTLGLNFTEEFMECMTKRENEAEYLTSVYYNQFFWKNYTFMHKVCSVRELVEAPEEQIIVKKCEDEDD